MQLANRPKRTGQGSKKQVRIPSVRDSILTVAGRLVVSSWAKDSVLVSV